MYTQSDMTIITNNIIELMPDTSEIYLFGSYARDQALENSDMDIAVITKKELDWKTRKSFLNGLYSKMSILGYNADFLIKTKSDFDDDAALPTLSRIIKREGRLLWQNQ